MTKTFANESEHQAFVAAQAVMPQGFRAGTTRFEFVPAEVTKPAKMNLTLLVADEPTTNFAAVFTRNAVAGAPVLIGRQRLAQERVGAIIINNKISNVGTATGVADAEAVCHAVGQALNIPAQAVMPASTGVIGWRLPSEAIVQALPGAVSSLSAGSLASAAQAIMTTDLYPKARTATVGGGRITAIAKGAGMIEPNMATMLAFVLTDLDVPRAALRPMLAEVVDRTFNAISIDSDTSTSDMVVALSSGKVPCPDLAAFEQALHDVCARLAEDVVRNGEGVHHVIRVTVKGVPEAAWAKAIGKAIVNSPLVKTAVCGNDPNVGRVLAAVGKTIGAAGWPLDPRQARVAMGGHAVFANGAFCLTPAIDDLVRAHLEDTELYTSKGNAEGMFYAPVKYPPHDRCVEIEVSWPGHATDVVIVGADLSHEYVTENADYRS
ncbi:MAG: bifunctional glutamate N-acetyltransferase/amino-acid acetyltransferase ArgJ [Deltaproteobacteria bacterium]|nr:bifunctional glutamate N-acetyltransferase/amino-acid acetyltransferase ArgJ [Deltaproteobacteria bacterium]